MINTTRVKIDPSLPLDQMSIYEEPLTELRYIVPGQFPNQRKLVIPDPGYTYVDMDLDRADAQFVAWEANDQVLKQILKEGLDLHHENAKMIWGEHVTKKSPERKLAKVFCHAANYGAYPKRLAKALGISVKLAEWIYARWFQIHPGIREWHNRTRMQLATERLIRNPFGFERYYFERPEDVLNEALAWLPQSSVGIIINKAWKNINDNLPEVDVQMQNHDSLNMQVKTEIVRETLPKIQEQSLIVVPYDDPLIIPVGFATSEVSWGDVEDPCWEDVKDGPPRCKDPELHSWLTAGLQRAKSQALSRLA